MRSTKLLAIVLMLVIACVLLAACGAADGGETESANPLVGDWASQDYSGAFIFTFNEDGTGNYDAAGTQMPFTYTAEDGQLSILYDGDTLPFESEYTVEGTVLTMKDSLGEDVIYNKQ